MAFTRSAVRSRLAPPLQSSADEFALGADHSNGDIGGARCADSRCEILVVGAASDQDGVPSLGMVERLLQRGEGRP